MVKLAYYVYAYAYVVILTSSQSIVFSSAAVAKATLRGNTSGNNGIDVEAEVPMNHLSSGNELNEATSTASTIAVTRDLRSTSKQQHQQQHKHRRVIAKNGGDMPTRTNLFASNRNNDNKHNTTSPPPPLFSSMSISSTSSRGSRLQKESRIIGGSATGSTEFPYVVSIQDQYGHFCGGSLIAPNIVLTAAHCLGGSYNVVIGRHRLSSNDGQTIAMKREFTHPNYNAYKSDNDFGIIILAESATNAQAVRINPTSSYPGVGASVTVVGYGDTTQSDFTTALPESLMKVNVNVISNADCEDSSDGFENYYNSITSNMLCASVNQGGKDACQGDSGGPLFASSGNGYVQVGVVSWGIGCATAEFPGVYSRISSAYEWIRGQVCEYGADPKPSSFNCGGSSGSGSSNSGTGSGSSSTGTSNWSTIFATDFTNGVTPFIDGGANAQRLDAAKFREGIIHLQNQGEMRTKNFDVHSYTRCRTNLNFMVIGLDSDDEWCVDYSSDNGSSFVPIQCYSTQKFEAKKWWDGRRATFTVAGANTIQLRLKSKGDSRQDDVLISSAKLQCRK